MITGEMVLDSSVVAPTYKALSEHAVAACEYYHIDPAEADAWFAKWYPGKVASGVDVIRAEEDSQLLAEVGAEGD